MYDQIITFRTTAINFRAANRTATLIPKNLDETIVMPVFPMTADRNTLLYASFKSYVSFEGAAKTETKLQLKRSV